MRLPKSFCGLIASLLVCACGSSTEPRYAEAPSPTAVEREPKTPPALPEPRGPAGLLETSPAETWDRNPAPGDAERRRREEGRAGLVCAALATPDPNVDPPGAPADASDA